MGDWWPDPPRPGVGEFLHESRTEFRKVTWPSRATLVTYSKVVLVAICALGTFVLAVDLLFSRPPL
jgi:preprotein translocase subunit SecE